MASRLAMVLVLALSSRAAAQYGPPPGERSDPYSPTYQAPQVQARYPLQGSAPAAMPAGANGGAVAQPPLPQPIGPNQRYPLSAAEGAPATNPPAAAPSPGVPPPSAPPLGASGVTQAYLPVPTAGVPGAASGSTDLFEPAQIVAVVGDKYIFYGDVAPTVSQILDPYFEKATSDAERAELEKARAKLTAQVVRQIVDTKLMYLEFERQIEKNAGREKLAEVRKDIEKRMRDSFQLELAEVKEKVAVAKPEKVQELMKRDPVLPRLAMLMHENQAETMTELDAILRRTGSSLDKQIRLYGENKLGRSSVGKYVNFKPEITHQEMLDYYHEHQDEFAVPAKARFELLTVKFASFPNKNAAWNAIAQMGNEIYFGAPFATIARKHSQEPNAQKGGLYDWTTQGSLASEPINQALFTLDIGKLSQIIEDDRGFHIVRVLERSEAGSIPFLEAQSDIKETLTAQKREADYKEFTEMLRTRTTVWTVYDDQQRADTVARTPGDTAAR
jgi:hypothetical protein